ncbi:MAG TPA: TniQ family protein [Candidatus Nanopelagicales bacterium]|nr:TniQ family protein [Candidatus Nanopelagicales bacterium]
MLADNADTYLPTLVDLAPGEALDAYLERVADANYLTTARLMELVRAGHDTTTAYLMLAPTPVTLERIARLTGADTAALQNATLAAFDGTSLDLRGLDPARQTSFRTISARGWIPGHGTQICPACLADDGVWRTTWRLPTTTVCRTHGTYLLATCPGCQRPFRDQRHSPLRVVGPQTVCGNPLGQGPHKQCRVDLTTLTAELADEDCLQRQARQDAADAGGTVPTFAGQLDASEFTTTLRSLTALLLHLAAATRTPHELPSWTCDVADADTDRVRRWSIRPPQDPALRSRALTAADHILAAEDIDTAATRLGSWLQHIPGVPEGRLGWLADHTRITPTLTRLVMAAHAPRRRLSHLLDQQPPLTASTRQIPQVLPSRLVDEHLAGLFHSRPTTVGLFASLCLARTHPHIHSWADAACELGLPPELGERTARACSASMTASPADVVTALGAASGEMDVDHRELEDRVRHLARTTRWFTQWARIHRPGTHPASHGCAVLWIWLEVVHGQAGTAPAGASRSAFRKFVRSLGPARAGALSMTVRTLPTTQRRTFEPKR